MARFPRQVTRSSRRSRKPRCRQAGGRSFVSERLAPGGSSAAAINPCRHL